MRLLLLSVVSSWLLAPALAAAQPTSAPGFIRFVVRVTDAADRSFVERIRGQVVDLPVVLVEASSRRLERRRGARHRAAVRLSVRESAQAVVWLEPVHGAIDVLIAVPETGQLQRRRIREAARTPSSATLESAALIVRNAMRSLWEGVPLPTEERLAPEVEVNAEHAQAETPPASPRIRVALSAGYLLTLDGTSFGPGGPSATVGVIFGHVESRLGGSVQLPVEVADDRAAVELTRYEVHLYSGGRFALDPTDRWTLQVGARIGLVAYDRSTIATDAGLVATDGAVTESLVLGLAVGVQLRVTGPLHVGLAGGVDIVPSSLRLAYQDGDLHVLRTLWSAQPWLELRIGLELPHID